MPQGQRIVGGQHAGGVHVTGGGTAGTRVQGGGTAGTKFGSGGAPKKKDGGVGIGTFIHAGPWSVVPHLIGEGINALTGGAAKPVTRPYEHIAGTLGSAIPVAVVSPKTTALQFGSMLKGVAEMPFALEKSIKAQGLKVTLKTLADSIEEDFHNRYGADWQKYAQEEPLNNLLDALSVLGVSARGTALAAAASRLSPGDARIATFLKHPRATVRESGNFGPRKLEYITPQGKSFSATQTYSRSPLRAITQSYGDVISSRFPTAPGYGLVPRVARAQASQIQRTVNRTLAEIPGMEAVGRLRGGERARVYWGSQMGAYDARTLRSLRDALASHYAKPMPDANAPFAYWRGKSLQAGFGKGLLKNIDSAIEEATKNPKILKGSKVDAAIKGMEHATKVNEQTILDAYGFQGVIHDINWYKQALGRVRREIDTPEGPAVNPEYTRIADKIKALQDHASDLLRTHVQIMDRRRGLLVDFRNANYVVKSAARTAQIADWTRRFGDDQAEFGAKLYDAAAMNARPYDPGSWWEDKVGRPTEETAKEFLARTAGDANTRMQYTLGPFGGEDADLFFSRMQKAVDEMPGKQMLMKEFLSRIASPKYGVAKEEQFWTGFLNFATGIGPNEKVSKQELLDLLDSARNEFHLVEHHWDNSPIGEQPPYLSEIPGIASRQPMQGMYHHVAFGLPQERMRYGRMYSTDYGPSTTGGFSHSIRSTREGGRFNIIGHFRFQFFVDESDGKLKMLVEEMQSDWAKDVGRQRPPTPILKPDLPLTPQEGQELADLGVVYDRRQGELQELEKKWRDLDYDRHYAADEDLPGIAAQIAITEQHIRDVDTQLTLLGEDIRNLEDKAGVGVSALPPSPLGEKKYAMSMSLRLRQIAHRYGVDEVVMTDPTTQIVRNAGDPWDDLPAGARDMTHAELGPALAADEPHLRMIVDDLRGQSVEDEHNWALRLLKQRQTLHDMYGEKGRFVKAMNQVFGPGEYRADAYTGEVGSAYDPNFLINNGESAPVGGMVWKMTDEIDKKAEQAAPYYQRMARAKYPRGATEFLADGKTAVRLFNKADLSTVVHELFHIATPDLSEGDINVLKAHFGDDFHEGAAKAFERYLQSGKAPTRALEPVFARISEWMSGLWKNLKKDPAAEGLHPEIRDVFDGIFQGGQQPRVYIPHRPGMVELSGARVSRGVSRNRRTIGDEVLSQSGKFKKNRLALLSSGMLNPDPRLLSEAMNRNLMLSRANQLRDTVYRLSRPLQPGEIPSVGENGTQYVVKRAGKSDPHPLLDAMENQDDPEAVKQAIAQFTDEHITDNPDVIAQWEKELADDPTRQLNVVDKTTIDHLFKNVTGKTPGATTKPETTVGRLIDAALDTTRGMLLYANPGFYVANMVGNSMMMMMSDPRALQDVPWSFRQAFKGAGRGERSDELWNRAAVEMGRGPSSGVLSERESLIGGNTLSERRNRLLRAAERGHRGALARRTAGEVSHLWGMAGRFSGRFIDDSWRVAAWRMSARKRGYATTESQLKLLDDAVRDSKRRMSQANSKALRDLNGIRDEAEQLMLDFDSMTPFEKTWLTRIVFLYPFIKASAKYPFMYAGERPLVAGVGGQAALQANLFSNRVLGPPDESLPEWMHGYARTPWGYLPVTSVSPVEPFANLLLSAQHAAGEPELGIQRPWDYLSPFYQLAGEMMMGQNKFGRSQPALRTLGQEFPAPAYIRQAFGHPPGRIYADRGWLATLERSFRLPFEINEAEARRQKAKKQR